LTLAWIILSAWCAASGWILSLSHALNQIGYTIALIILLSGLFFLGSKIEIQGPTLTRALRKAIHRFRKPLPAIYLLTLILALAGGLLYPPTNYDYLTYRLGRVLHWWAQGQWHWIETNDDRMNISAPGFEWLMMPLFVFTKSDRFFFLINFVSYLLLPGLIFSSLRGLGIRRAVASRWMWLFAGAYCYVTQASSTGNDLFSVVYFLAALAFAQRARQLNSPLLLCASLFAAALLTGAKASNIPLILPIAISWWPLRRLFLDAVSLTAPAACVALLVSFLPMAIINQVNVGQWAGDAQDRSQLQIFNPIAGIVGNALQLGVNTIVPPIFPFVAQWNAWVQILENLPFWRWLIANFPHCSITTGEIAIEEGAGIGFGIGVLWLILVACRLSGLRSYKMFEPKDRLMGHRNLVLVGGLVASAAFFAKMGSEAGPRLLAPYYPVFLMLVLRWAGPFHPKNNRAWEVTCYLVAIIPIFLLILNPARPLLPMQQVADRLPRSGAFAPYLARATDVYRLYANRADVLAPIRKLLPPTVSEVGLIANEDDPEIALWRPFGERHVVDIVDVFAKDKFPEYVAVSQTVLTEQSHFTIAEWARAVGLKEVGRAQLVVKLHRGPETWFLFHNMNRLVQPAWPR
jgi:hypothetical protein